MNVYYLREEDKFYWKLIMFVTNKKVQRIWIFRDNKWSKCTVSDNGDETKYYNKLKRITKAKAEEILFVDNI